MSKREKPKWQSIDHFFTKSYQEHNYQMTLIINVL